MTPTKCAHPACCCPVEGKKFCSDQCQISLMKPEAAALCPCNHDRCKAPELIAV